MTKASAVRRRLCCRSIRHAAGRRQVQRAFDASLWFARDVLLCSGRLLRLCCHARIVPLMSTNARTVAEAFVKTLMSIEPTDTAIEVVIIVDIIQIDIITRKQIIRVEKLMLVLSTAACASLVAPAPHLATTPATADTLTIKETILAMLESIALHGNLVERKFVLYRQLALSASRIH